MCAILGWIETPILDGEAFSAVLNINARPAITSCIVLHDTKSQVSICYGTCPVGIRIGLTVDTERHVSYPSRAIDSLELRHGIDGGSRNDALNISEAIGNTTHG